MTSTQSKIDRILPWFLLGMKVLTAARTGIDTYTVSNDLLNVLLLDGIFLALWLGLSHGGKAPAALALRPFAAFFAFVMYAAMVGIGWEAHTDAPLVAIAVRLGGLMLLVYDIWEYIVVLNQSRSEANARNNLAVQITGWRLAVKEHQTAREVDHDIRMAEQESRRKVGLLSDNLRRDLNIEKDQWFYDVYRPMLDEKFEEMVSQAMNDAPIDTTMTRSYPRLPEPKTTKSVPVSSNTNEQWSNSGRTVVDDADAVMLKWSEVYSQLPDTFNRKKVEEICECKSTWAVRMINYGKQYGQVIEIARGKYRKVLVVDGEVREDAQPSVDNDTPPQESNQATDSLMGF